MKNFLILISSISLIACEKGTTFQYEVSNNTDKAIEVKIQNNFTAGLETTSIAAGESKTVLFLDQQGLFDDNFKCGQLLDSVWITSNDTTRYIGEDLSQNQGWTLSESSNSGGDTKDCECRIEQNDFE